MGYAFDPKASWWSSIVPEESRNLVVNPSFEKWNVSDLAVEYNFGGVDGTVGYVEFPSVGATAGRRCARIIFGGSSRWIEYDEGIVVTPGTYTFGLDVHCNLPNVRLQLTVLTDAVATIASRVYFTQKSGWQRLHITYPEIGTGIRVLRLTVVNTSPTGTIMHTDAWQFEAKPYPTTYLDGDMVGFYDLRPNQSFYWEGAAHASTSVRRRSTGAGGRLAAWDDEIGFLTTGVVGLGMGTVEPFTQVLSDGTEIHRGSNMNVPVDFTITGRIYGSDFSDVKRRMRELTRLIRPNNTVDGSQQIIRYQQTNARGLPLGSALDIACVYRDGMSAGVTNLYQQALGVQFHASQPHMIDTIDSAAELLTSQLLYNNTVIMRDADGEWINLSTDSFSNRVDHVDFDSQGRPLAAGPFTTIGAEAIEDVAYWDGVEWQQLGVSPSGAHDALDGGWRFGFPTVVSNDGQIYELRAGDNWVDVYPTGVAGTIFVLARDVSGDIYGGGFFEEDGAADPNYSTVFRYDYVDEDFHNLEGGLTHATLNPQVNTILIHEGHVYFGGLFDEALPEDGIGPSVATNYVAVWDIEAGTWDSMSSGLNDTVDKLILGEDGFIYAVGEFTQNGAEDTDLRGIARWNGVEWEEPFILVRADGTTYGAEGVQVDEHGVMWFFQFAATDDATLYFDVSQTIGISENFGWKNGVFYPTLIRNTHGITDMAIGPGDRMLVAFLNADIPAELSVQTPAMNRVEYEGDANTPIIVHFNGEMSPIHLLNLDNEGGVYFLPDLTVGPNEEMVIRTDIQASIMYSEGRANLYRYMSAGPSSTKLLFLRPGENRISIFAHDNADALAWLIWRNRYWGIEGAE